MIKIYFISKIRSGCKLYPILVFFSFLFTPAYASPIGLKNVTTSKPSINSSDQQIYEETRNQFKKILETEHVFEDQKVKVPGGSFAILQDGHSPMVESFGCTNYECQGSVTLDSMITVGSLSKLVTAMTVFSLVEEGLIDLDRPVNDYLKRSNFQLERHQPQQQDANLISVRQSLQHLSGIPDELPSGQDEYGPSVCTADQDAYQSYFELHKNDPLWLPPGKAWNYSNVNYILVAAVVESVTGQSFEDVATERVLRPAGMTSASWDADKLEESTFAYGYDYWAPYRERQNLTAFSPLSTPCRIYRPAAGLHASIRDFSRLAHAVITQKKELLSPSSFSKLFFDQVPTGDEAWSYSYGLFTMTTESGVTVIGHDGISWGYRTMMVMVPDKKFALLAFVHGGLSFPIDLWSFAMSTLSRYLNLSERSRPQLELPEEQVVEWVGVYQGVTFDPDYLESTPKYANFEIQIQYDPFTKKLLWFDDWYGPGVLKLAWWPKFRVDYDNPLATSFEVRFMKDPMSSDRYLVSRQIATTKVSPK